MLSLLLLLAIIILAALPLLLLLLLQLPLLLLAALLSLLIEPAEPLALFPKPLAERGAGGSWRPALALHGGDDRSDWRLSLPVAAGVVEPHFSGRLWLFVTDRCERV